MKANSKFNSLQYNGSISNTVFCGGCPMRYSLKKSLMRKFIYETVLYITAFEE
jgi:hypothetical protein